MILQIKTNIGEFILSKPPFKFFECTFGFGTDKSKVGNMLLLKIISYLNWYNPSERTTWTIAAAEYENEITTDGRITIPELYKLFSQTTDFFKNQLASRVPKDSTLPKNIVCPELEAMQATLQEIIDWFDTH